jgi:hypothetical protein
MANTQVALQEITLLLIDKFIKKPPFSLFATLSNLAKMSFWTSCANLTHPF